MKGRESSIKKLIGKSKKWRNGIKNEDKIKKQVMNELAEMRQRIAELEASETRRKQAEEKLRESDAKYYTLVESSRDGIIIIQDGVLKFVNTASVELVGYSPEELIGIDFLKLVASKDREMVKKRYADRMAGKEVPSIYGTALIRKDGTTLSVELNATLINYEGKPANLVFIRDITERKEMERALKESEEKFRTFMETASDLMHIADKDGNFTYVNESMARTLGYSKEEMIGMHIGQVISEESMKDFEPGWKELVTKGRFTYEPTWVTKDGKEIYGEIKVVAIYDSIYDSDGKYAGSRAVFRDITEQKKAKEQIKIQKSYFENLFEMSPDALVTIDKDDRIIQINKEFTNLFGYQNDEAVGKQINDLIAPPEHKEEGLAASRLIAKGERVHFESVRQAKDGRNIEVEIISKPVILGKGQLASQGIYRDITDRKRMEEELIRLANAVRMSTDSIVISDIKGKIIDVNKATLKMYGTEDKGDLIGKNSFDLIVPEEREKALESLKKVLKGGYVTGREYHIITKDGSKILVEMNSAIMKDTNGKPIGFVGITRDITERKRMEEALKEDEERLRTILDHLQAGIVVIDEETHEIVDVNPMAAKMIGLPKEEIIGRVCHKFICPAEVGKCPITDLGQSIDNSERVLINADDEEVPILKTTTSMMLKNRRFIIDSFINVSEQKQAEEKLRESEERFRTIVETAPSLLSITDAKGNHIYVSPNCEEITGYTQEELLGGVRWWVHENDMPRAKELFERTFREGMGGKDFEHKAVKKNGELWYASSSWEPLRDKEGKFKGIVFQTIDITDRKRVEEALAKSELKLKDILSDAQNVSIIGTDLGGKDARVIFFNKGAENIFGYKAEEIVGKPVAKLHLPEDVEKFPEIIEAMKKGKEGFTGESILVRKNGEKFPAAFNTFPLKTKDGEMYGTVGISIDITEHKKAGEKLKKAYEELKSLDKPKSNIIANVG